MPDISLVSVTPKIAEKWLSANTDNRPLRPGVVERYAADMREGNWTQCVTPISFYEDGSVADGQHRLWAVVESGTTQKFVLLQGLKRADGANIDRGLTRHVADNLRLSGLFSRNITFNMTANVKSMDAGASTRYGAHTQAEVLKLLEAYYDLAEWVESHGPRRKFFRNACFGAALMRALQYEFDKDRLAQFCRVVDEGFAEGAKDSAAVAIRNYVLERGNVCFRGAEWVETFNRIQNAIWNFMRGNKLTVIKRTEIERYQLKGPQVLQLHAPVKKSAAIINAQKGQKRAAAKRANKAKGASA